MITKDGYSKQPDIIPEGIVITFGQKMIQEQGGLRFFLRAFEKAMANEQVFWLHTMSMRPKIDADIIYIIVANRLYGKVFCGGYRENPSADVVAYGATGKQKLMEKPFMILSGPFERCPFKRELRGFQGFRYCTKLF